MPAVVGDTHASIWYLFDPDRLSDGARATLTEAERDGYPIYVPSISSVETQYLIERRRIAEDVLTSLIVAMLQPNAAMVLVPLGLKIALVLQQVPRDAAPDMPDRIIAATALYLGAPLVTADHRLRALSIETIW